MSDNASSRADPGPIAESPGMDYLVSLPRRVVTVYVPLTAFEGRAVSAAEREFLRSCLDRIRPRDGQGGAVADVVQLDGGCVAERKHGVGIEWTAPFEVILRSARLVSKRSCLEAILPALRRGIGADEGGIYTPYGGDGIFHLISM